MTAGQGAFPRSDSSVQARSAADASVGLNAAPSRHIGIKQILACVDGTDTDRAVLNHALQVALRFGSHIDVLHVRFDVRASAGTAYGRQVDRLLGISVERVVAEAATHARRHFEEWHAQCKLPFRDTGTAIQEASIRWREIVGCENEVVARLGRLSDLIVISRPSERSSSFSLMALETALFDTCRPVLLVPDGATASLFHRPLIAWNGSLEAARAVGFALPFLVEVESGIEVFAAPESKHHTESDELLRYLSWHGITAHRIPLEGSDATGPSLLAQADANQAGLVIMGAYTHGHYRQFLFGGVTRYVMEHAGIPILLAH